MTLPEGCGAVGQAAPAAPQQPALWRDLRRFTDARVGLGRAGTALPTAAHLDFQEAHARARDAVWSSLDVPALEAAIGLPVTLVHSNAPDRRTYLLRPDLGRRLADGVALPHAPGSVAFVVADGLCAIGVQRHAPRAFLRGAAHHALVHAQRLGQSDRHHAALVGVRLAPVEADAEVGAAGAAGQAGMHWRRRRGRDAHSANAGG